MKTLALKLFGLYAGKSYRRLEDTLKHPRQAQLHTLTEILKLANLPTKTWTYRQFRQLPLQSYEDLETQIQKAITAQSGYLSHQKPFNYEPTSGSSGAKKLIPYTSDLIQSFTNLFRCWAYDMLQYGPPLTGGRLYFSVSPQFHESEYGLTDDSDYLSGLTGLLFKRFSLVPNTVKALNQPEDFFRVVSLYLLAAKDLEIISIWSPSFLLAFVDYIASHRDELKKDLQTPEISLAGRKFKYGQISVQKLKALDQAELQMDILFPALKLISCWGANNALAGYRQLQTLFPKVLVQEKGLLATEAPLTFPSLKYQAFLPLLTEVFFEFLDDTGNVWLIDQLSPGSTYELVISQKSGLLRYKLKDRVHVTHLVQHTPCFTFLERSEEVCDLVGEKLNENLIASIANKLTPDAYLCLVPDLQNARYILFSDRPVNLQAFEQDLMASPHYQNAIKLKQLKPLELRVRTDLAARIKHFFTMERNMRLGDIKDRSLYTREGNGQLADYLSQD